MSETTTMTTTTTVTTTTVVADPWVLVHPGVEALRGTSITVVYEHGLFSIYTNGIMHQACTLLEEAKAAAMILYNELVELGLAGPPLSVSIVPGKVATK